MPGEPVEPHVRSEVPPDDAIVIVRGGPIAAEKIVEHALRQARWARIQWQAEGNQVLA